MTQAAFDWNDQNVKDTIGNLAEFGLKLLAFFAILIIGWIVAKIIRKATDAILERVGFDRAVERGGIKQMLARSNYDASDIVAKLVYYIVLLLVVAAAFNVFGQDNPISEMLSKVIAFLPKLIVAIILVVVAAAVAKAVKDMISTLMSSTSYGNLVGSIAAVAIIVFGIKAALDMVGVATTVSSIALIAIMATVGGILVVGVGGSLINALTPVMKELVGKAQSNVSSTPGTSANAQGYVSPTGRPEE